MRVRGEWFDCDPKFVEWVCDNVLSGGREKAEKAATLFCELNRLEIHPERHILDESLHNLGFDTVGYRIKAAVLRERANRESPGAEVMRYEPNYYRENVIGGPGAFVLQIVNFDTFAKAMTDKLIAEIADASPPHSLRGRSPLNHPRRDLVRSIGVYPAYPPTPGRRPGVPS